MNEFEFGLKVKQRRERLGLSQKDVAKALNIDQGKVSLIEKGLRRVDVVRELPALANVLRCSINVFFQELSIQKEKGASPYRDVLEMLFPGANLTPEDINRITNFIEPIIISYVETDPVLKEKVPEKLFDDTKSRFKRLYDLSDTPDE